MARRLADCPRQRDTFTGPLVTLRRVCARRTSRGVMAMPERDEPGGPHAGA